jgi:hypothetical protein
MREPSTSSWVIEIADQIVLIVRYTAYQARTAGARIPVLYLEGLKAPAIPKIPGP